MTVRCTKRQAEGSGSYYVDELGTYYLDGTDGVRRWLGRGAEALGLDGRVDHEQFLRLCEGDHPVTGAPLGRRHRERDVRLYDLTFSAPKSVSVLMAVAGPDVAREVLDAHDAAVTAVQRWVEGRATTRYRWQGEICYVDVAGIVAMAVQEHTSRALDPQLHTHLVIPNRVLAADGRWLALAAEIIMQDQPKLSALYHATLQAELTARLGLRWATDGEIGHELADVPVEVNREFSARTAAYEQRLDTKMQRFRRSQEREPTGKERWRLQREAALESRGAKVSNDAETLAQQWMGRLVALGVVPDRLVAEALHRAEPATLDAETTEGVMTDAVEALSARQSTWTSTDIIREIARAMPTTIAADATTTIGTIEAIAQRIETERLIDITPAPPQGIPCRRDGRPITEKPQDRRFTTEAILDEEIELVLRADRRLEAGGEPSAGLRRRVAAANVDATDDRGRVILGADQLDAAAAVAGTVGIVTVIGPAGTGKTTALRTAVDQFRHDGRVVFGVAPSATAAAVLEAETGVSADTVDKLLCEHDGQRAPMWEYDRPAGATVLVDEAGMVATDKLRALFALADEKAWRLVLVGDPRQFAPVGRGGMFDVLCDRLDTHLLGTVHRFAEPWEQQASLRLRRGMSDAIGLYERHGRIHGGHRDRMIDEVIDRWWTARTAGESVSMTAPTREAVTALNLAAQSRRIRCGELHEAAEKRQVGDVVIHAGDEVVTRRNDRTKRTDTGQMVKNRDLWVVRIVHGDGSLTLTGATGTVRVDREYVDEHVELAYAETSHASQGRTVDRSLLFLDASTDCRGVYVPMTRGRHSNDAFVVEDEDTDAADLLRRSVDSDWIDRPALVVQAELFDPVVERRGEAQPGVEGSPSDGGGARRDLEGRRDLEVRRDHRERIVTQMRRRHSQPLSRPGPTLPQPRRSPLESAVEPQSPPERGVWR